MTYFDDDKRFSKNIKKEQRYEDFLIKGKNFSKKITIKDEWFPISLSYTSGTTNKPKGVVNIRKMQLTIKLFGT